MNKQIFALLILILLLFTGCQTTDKLVNIKNSQPETIPVEISQDESQDIWDDLVYHDYETSIYLQSNLSATISNLDLDLIEESANLYAIRLESKEAILVGKYVPNQTVSFTSKLDGNYIIIAITSAGKTIDITPNAIIATTYEIDEGNGIIPLK